MDKTYLFICVCVCVLVNCTYAANLTRELTEQEKDAVIKKAEKKVSDQVLAIIEHYKQKDPVGIPGVPIPDPLKIPPLKHSFSVATMDFITVNLYGLSKFRIDHIQSNIADMIVEAALTIDTLDVNGTYTLATWFSRSKGPFTVTLSDVYIQGIARLEVERDGQLRAQDMNMDITFKKISMNFENLGFMANIFQGIINSVGTFLFDSIKPFILSEVNTNMRSDINKQLSAIPQRFPNSISPLDTLIAEYRRKFRDMGYDPYKVEDYNHTAGVFGVQMTHTWLTGLTSFYRVGNITFEVWNHTVMMGLNVGTQQLQGKSHWEVSLAGMLSRAGTLTFTVDYFKVFVNVSQSMDMRKHPLFNDLQMELGNIQVRCNGAGTMDYVMEFVINILPNLLRYQIMDALETPFKLRAQEFLDTVNMENIIHEKLPEIDNKF